MRIVTDDICVLLDICQSSILLVIVSVLIWTNTGKWMREELAHTSIRFGIGRFTTEAEVDEAIRIVTGSIEKLRAMSPLWEMVQEGVDISKIEWAAH